MNNDTTIEEEVTEEKRSDKERIETLELQIAELYGLHKRALENFRELVELNIFDHLRPQSSLASSEE
mgnify:CR=1 FL=1|tara:strand:- start:240 stop:440 length:201 start_codon:yes stop_codon:yes gene_type:complete